MGGTLILAALLAAIPQPASAQTAGVLHIKVTLVDADQTPVPVAGHALLISDNPATSSPRRVVTGDDGIIDVRLRPGNYTVESDEPFPFSGKGYEWTQTLDVVATRQTVLDLTLKNADVVPITISTRTASPTSAAEGGRFLAGRWRRGRTVSFACGVRHRAVPDSSSTREG